MTVLNTFTYWDYTDIFALLVTFSCFTAIPLVIFLLTREWKLCIGTLIISLVLGSGALLVHELTPRTIRHQVFLEDMPASELIEKYNIIESDGLILTIEEKLPD